MKNSEADAAVQKQVKAYARRISDHVYDVSGFVIDEGKLRSLLFNLEGRCRVIRAGVPIQRRNVNE